MNFKASPYQEAIFDFVQNGQGNAVIDAVAGSGKSTTIIQAVSKIPADQSVLFLAFNKAIVDELKVKLKGSNNVQVMTLHSLGVKSLMWAYGSDIKADKYKAFLNDGLREGYFRPMNSRMEPEHLATYKSNILKLIDLVRVNLCNSVDQFMPLAYKHGLDILDNECTIAAKVCRWGYKNTGEIDFTDMVYFPVAKKLEMPKYDWVFIDECQDLNSAQRELFLKCIKPETGRFIAVGDPRQAIYGFAGADIESFKLLKELPNTGSFPLSVCYRCDESIVNLAKTIVPQIEARQGASKGQIELKSSVCDVLDGDMILCRLTFPLVALCMRYIADGTKAYIKGRDIGVNLINMIKNTNKDNIPAVLKKLEKELTKIQQRVMDSQKCSPEEAGESTLYINYLDKFQAIEALSDELYNSKDVINRINSIFGDNSKAGICLSTIHRSKGLEADRVFILMPELLMFPKAMLLEWTAEQEENLVYVAYTRAKHFLGFINDFELC